MDSKDIRGLFEAYTAVYDENLREDILNVEEEFEFIDELSDNELDQVMEEIIIEESLTLDECFEIFDEVISEARVDMAARAAARKQYAAASEKSAKEARARGKAKERSERRAERVERIKSSAQRAAQNVKTKAAGAASAVAGGAAEAGRKVSAGAKKVSGKLASAKERIKGFMGRVGRAAKAGASAAKKEFSGEAGREAQARTTGRQMRRAARNQAADARAKDTSAFQKPKASVGTSENPRIGQPAPERKALPQAKTAKVASRRQQAAAKLATAASGTSSKPGERRIAGAAGVSPLVSSKKDIGRYSKAASGEKRSAKKSKVTISAGYEILADMIAEDLINEGYASDLIDAYDCIIEMNDAEIGEIAESYLSEEIEVETLDLYDVVMEHLLEEGYAETEEAAEVIMVNMSEEWREEIVEARRKSYSAKEARKGHDIGLPGENFEKIARSGSARYGKGRGAKIAGSVLAKLRAKHG